MIILLIALMYFFMIRPQQKQRRQHADMMSKLKPGDEVVTIGRLHGVVNEVNEKARTVTLDCEGIYLTFDLVAIQRVISHANDANSAASEQPAESSAAESSATESSATAAEGDSAEASEATSDESSAAPAQNAADTDSDAAEK